MSEVINVDIKQDATKEEVAQAVSEAMAKSLSEALSVSFVGPVGPPIQSIQSWDTIMSQVQFYGTGINMIFADEIISTDNDLLEAANLHQFFGEIQDRISNMDSKTARIKFNEYKKLIKTKGYKAIYA